MRALAFLSLVALSSPAVAADLAIQLRTPGGVPIRNAVVSLYPAGKPIAPAAAKAPYRIVQQDLQFSPFVLIVPVGAAVAFPNHDPVRHHVYSFSPAKRFELKLYAKEQNRTVRFDKPGVVALGCNIHDAMAAFIKVSDTALARQSDPSGRIRFSNLSGPVVARIWHPYLRAPGNQIELRWTIPQAGQPVQTVTLNLRSPPRVQSTY